MDIRAVCLEAECPWPQTGQSCALASFGGPSGFVVDRPDRELGYENLTELHSQFVRAGDSDYIDSELTAQSNTLIQLL